MCLCLCCSDCVLVIVAIFFPPIPVWIRRGLCSADSLINILLCTLGYLPGLIHSWYIISKYPSDYIYYDEEQRIFIEPSGIIAYGAVNHNLSSSQTRIHQPQPQRISHQLVRPERQEYGYQPVSQNQQHVVENVANESRGNGEGPSNIASENYPPPPPYEFPDNKLQRNN